MLSHFSSRGFGSLFIVAFLFLPTVSFASACGPVPHLPAQFNQASIDEQNLIALQSAHKNHQLTLSLFSDCVSDEIHALTLPMVNGEPAPEGSAEAVTYQAQFDALAALLEQVNHAYQELDTKYNTLAANATTTSE